MFISKVVVIFGLILGEVYKFCACKKEGKSVSKSYLDGQEKALLRHKVSANIF